MSKRSKKKRDRPPDDVNELAAYIVNQVTSDGEDDCPGNNPDQSSGSARSHNALVDQVAALTEDDADHSNSESQDQGSACPHSSDKASESDRS